MGKIRGNHVSPGIYTEINDLSYGANTLGITTLGLVGETKKGPAFEPIFIQNWAEFKDYFGGCSAEKFKESKYPKYELPYIAKSYLGVSDQLYVCRVLGLSGYNAGPAFVITASKKYDETKKYVIAILRSRGHYQKYGRVGNDFCSNEGTKYDTLIFDCDHVVLTPYQSPAQKVLCDMDVHTTSGDTEIETQPYDLGRFTINCYKLGEDRPENLSPEELEGKLIASYGVSFNSASKEYIYDVIGSTPYDGNAPVFIEEFYDNRLQELTDNGTVDIINADVTMIPSIRIEAVTDPVTDFMTIPTKYLTKKNLGQTYLFSKDMAEKIEKEYTDNGEASGETVFRYHEVDDNGKVLDTPSNCMEGNNGCVYTVRLRRYKFESGDTENTSTEYVYVPVKNNEKPVCVGKIKLNDKQISEASVPAVKVLSDGRFWHLSGLDGEESENSQVIPAFEMSDYREMFRCATTPWILSEVKGDGKNLDVKRLFRFHTITDGVEANSIVKVSVSNIRPDDGLFDITIRDYNDSDASPIVLESFRNLTMDYDQPNYIGAKIGTIDGSYETKSKYVTVEVIENDMTKVCVPCGFLGYPTRDYESIKEISNDTTSKYISPTFVYNTNYEEDIKDNKQYFGLSDITGVDIDMLYYKGKNAYTEDFENGYTNPFHLDCTLNEAFRDTLDYEVTLDGEKMSTGVTWTTVNPAYDAAKYDHGPIIGTEVDMEGCLFENVKLRKFTVYPCGGFDGWDPYRGKRSTGDEFKYNKYKGYINNGHGQTFSKLDNPSAIGLDSKSISSDYYAYLAGAHQFEIPEKNIINLFATPGIDYVNDQSLSEEILDMVENRADALYVMTTPDKPSGASDARDDMYSSSEAVDNLESTRIDTYYAATYYPWVKFYDTENAMYINLPATKDALRNMADVDNKRYPWYAPAGLERGNVECKKMHFFARIEDEDTIYEGRINPLKTFSEDGVKIWGNKTMYTGDTPMNRINTVRLVLYMRKLIKNAALKLIFDPNDVTLKEEFENIITPILSQIRQDRGITDYRLKVSQTVEQMDAHEMSAEIWVKPTPTLEYLEISFVITPQGVEFED